MMTLTLALSMVHGTVSLARTVHCLLFIIAWQLKVEIKLDHSDCRELCSDLTL
jgi:hypothetical protein